MRYLIFIKGDGRGHITQALALTQLLTRQGHEVCALIVGCEQTTHLPAFLFAKATVPVERIYSPNFAPDARYKGISWSKTILEGLRSSASYRQTFVRIKQLVALYNPDVLINLFEPMLTLYRLRSRNRLPMVSLAHQYLMLHQEFTFPRGRRVERSVVRNYTRFTRLTGDKMLALSFYDFPDDEKRHIYTVPPLLRSEVFERTPTLEDHFVIYVLSHGLAEDIQAFNRENPELRIHAFWNKKDAPETWDASPTLTFHQLSDTLFLDKMASCQGIACTAGFETVCEALYYRKPAILMPSANQYEQYVNAYDAEKVGAGKMVKTLDLRQLKRFLPTYLPQHQEYLDWMKRGAEKLMFHLEHPLANGRDFVNGNVAADPTVLQSAPRKSRWRRKKRDQK